MKTFISSSHQRTSRTSSDNSREDRRRILPLIVSPLDKERSAEQDQAIFKRRHEASTIELFLDLFFVANLTVFTKQHEIRSGNELSSYVGFFALLWCTWLQISIFDIRFSVDSIYGRVCKACHVGIMMTFAVAIPRWDSTDTTGRTIRSFKIIDFVLMGSRYLLAIQYLVVALFAREYRLARNPLLITTVWFVITASVFLGISFGFPQRVGRINTEIALYVVCGVEVLVTFVISSFWKALSFKHTHLAERFGLLTLIIIGEGIIGMALAISVVLDTTLYIAQFAGLLISGVLIIYFLYMLYFDQARSDKFGTIRMQIWALLHLPLHVAYLLTVEAIGQLIIWGTINNQTDRLTVIFDKIANPQPSTVPELIERINATIPDWASHVTNTSLNPLNLTEIFHDLQHTTDINGTEVTHALEDLVYECLDFLFETLQVEPPKAQRNSIAAATAEQRAYIIVGVFETIFYYFFIASGVALIMLSVLYWIGTRNKVRAEYLSICMKVVVGLGLALLATMGFGSGEVFANYFASPWLLPTVTLVFGSVLLMENLIAHFG